MMEGLKRCVSVVSTAFLLASVATAQAVVFDVTRYGAVADGATDMSQALSNAWKDACASTSPSRVFVPRGPYMLGPVNMSGPCIAPIEVHVQGSIMAPVELYGYNWICFAYVNGLILSGTGSFDGQGEQTWKHGSCGQNPYCNMPAVNIQFDFITNGIVRNLTSINSKGFHVSVFACNNFQFEGFTVKAPGTSPNTDGIHIGRSTGINITDTNIGTGDDCISLGDGNRQVRITRVNCGPGHGISIGSLGKYPDEQPVSGVFVEHCTISNTENGVRIKTWPGGQSGAVTDVHFKDIVMDNACNPVVIDQAYCPGNKCDKDAPSNVKISDVSFRGIRGTSATPVAISLHCSSSFPCQNVELSNINLIYDGPGGVAKAQCANVRPTIFGPVNPCRC